MKKLLAGFDGALLVWCLTITALLAVAVILSVFLRYVLGITFVWAEEVITMLFIATTFFGAALTTKEDEHIGIPALLEAVSKPARKVLTISGLLISTAVVDFLFHRSLNWIEKAGDLVTPGLRVPERYFYFMVPISAVLMAFYCLRRIFALLANLHDPDAPGS
jgi:TRAP-type C4-dicarboxylate transport system permease small subunit